MDVLAQKVHMYLEQKSTATPTLEVKSIELEVKASDDEEGIIEGYGNVFNVVDGVGDIVVPGAFAETIAKRGDQVKLLVNHNWDNLIGRVLELHEDEYGLRFKAKISQTAKGIETLQLIRDEVLTKISMGYVTQKAKWDNELSARRLEKVELYELSIVPVPANDKSDITSVKENMPLPEPERKAGRVLSAKTEKALREAFTALQDASDAMKIAQKEVEDVLALVDNPDDAASKVYDLPKGSDNELTVDDEQKALQAAEQERKQNEKLIELIEAMRKETAQLNSTN